MLTSHVLVWLPGRTAMFEKAQTSHLRNWKIGLGEIGILEQASRLLSKICVFTESAEIPGSGRSAHRKWLAVYQEWETQRWSPFRSGPVPSKLVRERRWCEALWQTYSIRLQDSLNVALFNTPGWGFCCGLPVMFPVKCFLGLRRVNFLSDPLALVFRFPWDLDLESSDTFLLVLCRPDLGEKL